MEIKIPDVLDPIEGWRIWIRSNLNPSHLRSVTEQSKVLWPHNCPLEALCSHSPVQKHTAWTINGHETSFTLKPYHEAPYENCSCGIYSTKTLATLIKRTYGWGYEGKFVAGKVKMWGKVIEHEQGYRAQHAQVSALLGAFPTAVAGWNAVPHPFIVRHMAKMYNVPILKLRDLPESELILPLED